MLGAIIGDIVGSRFEFNNHRSKDFNLFADSCFVTDDSIMTIAVAKAIMKTGKAIEPTTDGYGYNAEYFRMLGEMTVKYMQEIGRKYPNCGYGGMFARWLFSENPEPYNSFGNGAAMRISPAGFAAFTESEAISLSETITSVTHNHEEGIKGAEATAVAIYMARRGYLKSEIRQKITRDYYPIDFTINEIRSSYQFSATCQETVPQAMACFFESESFEDAIRTAISIGGDSDTIAAITGAIAEAYYGIPDNIRNKALTYLDSELRAVYDEWETYIGKDTERFKLLTKYIGKLSAAKSYGEWIIETENDRTLEHPIHFPFVGYSDLSIAFEKEFYQYSESHSEYELTRYGEILEKNGLKWGGEDMRSADLQSLDEQGVLALIMGAIRAERFCDGALLGFLKDGSLTAWLKRLKDIDWQRQGRQVTKIEFEIGGFFGGYTTYCLTFNDNGAVLREASGHGFSEPFIKQDYSVREADALRERFTAIHTEYWNADYHNPCVCDGEQWCLTACFSNGFALGYSGSNAYPENWSELLGFFGIDNKDEDDNDDESDAVKEVQMDEQQFLVIKDSSNIDVLDENLYCYDSAVFALTPAIQNRTSESLLGKIKQFIDSVPAAQKAKDYAHSKTQYIPRLDLISEEIKQALQNGTAEIIPCKDSTDAFYLQIRATVKGLMINGKEYGKNRKIKDIPLGIENIPADVAGAMQCLSMQNQLNQIANGLKEISEACEFNFGRIIQGQRDDRLAKLLSSRSCFIQALAMSDEFLQRQMLIQAIRDANSARAELAFQIKSDISLLGGDKTPKAKDMEKMVCDINVAIVAMNNAVQISLYSYQVLGERNAQLAVVKEHETFINQVLLKEIEYKGNKHLAWKLICSSGNSGLTPKDFGILPKKLLAGCDAFIENKNENSTNYLEGKSND